MSQLISFENYDPTESDSPQDRARESNNENISADSLFTPRESHQLEDTINLLLRINPGKINYTQREAATVLNMSYQFVNRKCKNGLWKNSCIRRI